MKKLMRAWKELLLDMRDIVHGRKFTVLSLSVSFMVHDKVADLTWVNEDCLSHEQGYQLSVDIHEAVMKPYGGSTEEAKVGWRRINPEGQCQN